MLKREILRVVRHVDETNKGTIEAVRDLWPEMSLSKEERETLMQEGLAARANDALRSSKTRGVVERAPENEIVIGVQVIETKREMITMSVEILERVSFDIHGERRKVADLTMEDTEHLMERSKAMIRGQLRQYQFAQYVHERLEATGASSVRGFGVREQRKLAQLLELIEGREDLKDLPIPNIKGLLER